ncbi:MAG: AcvB/VirJ family lysyl-phosphatidylglycerol hydrolase [Pseudomonadota bacterium]
MRVLLAALLALFDFGAVRAAEPLSDLPVHITEPPGGVASAVVVFWSGDAGWSSSMQGIADALADRGYGVAGVSSLRYFWHKQAPEVMAEDSARIASHFAKTWQTDRIVLVGYSFGADVLPFAWPHVPGTIREQTRLISLLSPFKKTEFEISLMGMLGIVRGQHEVEPAIEALPTDLVLCLTGEKETDMACNLGGGYEIASVPGGHSYDRNWALIANIIDNAVKQREEN